MQRWRAKRGFIVGIGARDQIDKLERGEGGKGCRVGARITKR